MSESRSQGSFASTEGWRVPLPPLLEIQRGELKSVAPWDEGPGPSSEPWERWLLKAMRGPLSPRKKRRLAEKLAAGRVSADRWTLELVEGLLVHNQEVLVEALANDGGREDAPRLVLVRLDVSLAHLEVMQKLISRGAMSEEYVLLHILNCVERCREGEDGSAKNRRARLFCLFLQQMIAGGFVNGKSKGVMSCKSRGHR